VKKDVIRDGFLETYDHIRDAVFVKNNESGEIIFANKAMEKLFGYSIVGMQAQDVVNDQMEQYRLIQGMRKRFIANNKVSKWQSYLKEVDQIMNVTEVQLSVFTNTNLSLVILKKNKNK
jgi:PAS domain S-box-containing protein